MWWVKAQWRGGGERKTVLGEEEGRGGRGDGGAVAGKGRRIATASTVRYSYRTQTVYRDNRTVPRNGECTAVNCQLPAKSITTSYSY